MSSQLSPPAPPPSLSLAVTSHLRALDALVALAESLVTPTRVPTALTEAETELSRAQEALKELEVARKAQVAPGVALGTLGDEDERELREIAAEAEEKATELEREREGKRRCQERLQGVHGVAMGLVVLCGVLLSLDSIRTALGVAEDSHLLLALGTVALSCQVAAQALATSQRHLGDTARQHRDMARRLRERARLVATARDNAKATAATGGDSADAQARLEAVTWHLGTLVAAVGRDAAVTPWGTRRREFRGAARALGDIAVALGTSGEGHEEVARRLEVARVALEGRGGDTGVALSPRGAPGSP